ncbi:MAG: hypothetical protein EPO26_03645 [Chloroflexota bacterium]|nr:MAG: hypothetical protein EPO26_03645 [Chloroflexota bacterium]
MTTPHGDCGRDWAHWRTIEGGYMFDRQALVEAYLYAVGQAAPGDPMLPGRARACIDAWPSDKEGGRAHMDKVFGALLDRDILHCPHGLPVGIDLARVPDAPWIPSGFLAGPAMGSGGSPWTRASLIALERVIRAGDRVLEIGTGTGVLALRCRSLGVSCVHCFDVDPIARAIARFNVRRARAGREITVEDPTRIGCSSSHSCLIVAVSAIWEILPALRVELPRLLNGGSVVASPLEGLAEAVQLETAIRDLGVRPVDLVEQDGWYSLIGRKATD